MNWKMLRAAARLVVRSKVFSTKLLKRVAESSGLTALHYAARRGDIEIVELLMEYKANPSIKNDLGRDVLSYCEAFPAIKDAIERVKRERKSEHHSTKKKTLKSTRKSRSPSSKRTTTSSSGTFTLQRRLSTATSVNYDMYLLSLSTILKMFGDEESRIKNMYVTHQDLLKSEKLVRYEDLPMESFVIFVSHQWNGFNHPDPNGRQIQVHKT